MTHNLRPRDLLIRAIAIAVGVIAGIIAIVWFSQPSAATPTVAPLSAVAEPAGVLQVAPVPDSILSSVVDIDKLPRTKGVVEITLEAVVAPPALAAPQSSTKIMAFTATWCKPCQQAKPRLTEIEKTVTVESIDIDRQPALARQYKVRRVPTFLVFAGTKIILRTNDVEAVATKIKTHGILGITLHGETARIKTTLPRSAAERANLKIGDIITHVNNGLTPNTAALIAAIRCHLPGVAVCLRIKRGESVMSITATLDDPATTARR